MTEVPLLNETAARSPRSLLEIHRHSRAGGATRTAPARSQDLRLRWNDVPGAGTAHMSF